MSPVFAFFLAEFDAFVSTATIQVEMVYSELLYSHFVIGTDHRVFYELTTSVDVDG